MPDRTLLYCSWGCLRLFFPHTKKGLQFGLVIVLVVSLLLGTGIPAVEASLDNEVQATFGVTYWHVAEVDSVDNVLLPGSNKQSAVVVNNISDSTGEPLLGHTITYNPVPGLTVGNTLFPPYVVPGGPPYVWQYPDTPEGTSWISIAGAIVGDPFDFIPGFSTSRSFSQTEFTGPGTQIISISATPQEEMDTLQFAVLILNDNMVNTVITGATGDGTINILPDGGLMLSDVINPVVGAVYSMQVTVSLAPDPGVTEFIYNPIVNVTAIHGTASGDEQAAVLDRTMEVGSWTVAAPDDYTWNWLENLT